MDAQTASTTKNDTATLRKSIQRKYATYHLKDPDRFPLLSFNTNRANYEPLRDSFEEEFFVVRSYSRNTTTISIPSTNTLALLFTNDVYIPGSKILNTCESYAEGRTKVKPIYDDFDSQPARKLQLLRNLHIKLIFGWVVGLLCLAGLLAVCNVWIAPAPSGLVIIRPRNQSVGSQEAIIEGKATNAKMVWVAVRPKANGLIWINGPIMVQTNQNWLGVFYLGNPSVKENGSVYEVRAFVNPTQPIVAGDILPNWPEAQLSSEVIEVIRGDNR